MSSWPERFTSMCQGGTAEPWAPVFIAESLPVNGVGDTWGVASAQGFGWDDIILADSVKVKGPVVSPQSWAPSLGTFSFDVGDMREVLSHWHRGALVRLKMSFAGWAPDEAVTVALGVLRNVSGSGTRWRVSFADPLALLHTRHVVDGNASLFTKLDQTTVPAAPDEYTAADGHIHVASVSGFERRNGGTGAVLVTPTSGDPFYGTWTGTAAGPPASFTGFTGGQFAHKDEAAQATDVYAKLYDLLYHIGYQTADDANALEGSTVGEVAYLYGHPMDLMREFLTSTGTHLGNGGYDKLPKTWGLGIPADLMSQADIELWKALVNCDGTYSWDLFATDEVASGLSFITPAYQACGIWLTMRQGKLTMRVAQDLHESSPTYGRVHSGVVVTDDDIATVLGYHAFDPQVAAEHRHLRIHTSGGTSTTASGCDHSGFPANLYHHLDCSRGLYDTQGREQEMREEVRDRLHPWSQNIPERVQLRCAGFRLAGLCPGDLVDLSTAEIPAPRNAQREYAGTLAMVCGVDPAWSGSHTDIDLAILPEGGYAVDLDTLALMHFDV